MVGDEKGDPDTRRMLERTLAGLDWVATRRGRAQALPGHLLTGIEGEEAVCFYLRRKGYTVVARRWSAGNVPGDLDLIAWQGPMLCFFEVKARTARDSSPAENAVDTHKAQHPAPASPPVCAPTARRDRTAGAFRRDQRVSCAGGRARVCAL